MWVNFDELLGKTITAVSANSDEITFETADKTYKMCHQQDCCESVYIESIVGELQDLVGNPILMAEENRRDDPEANESGTWTFYKLATIKGYVDIRWYGSSNGYYSESVNLYEV